VTPPADRAFLPVARGVPSIAIARAASRAGVVAPTDFRVEDEGQLRREQGRPARCIVFTVDCVSPRKLSRFGSFQGACSPR
jgi:hypothetical protein